MLLWIVQISCCGLWKPHNLLISRYLIHKKVLTTNEATVSTVPSVRCKPFLDIIPMADSPVVVILWSHTQIGILNSPVSSTNTIIVGLIFTSQPLTMHVLALITVWVNHWWVELSSLTLRHMFHAAIVTPHTVCGFLGYISGWHEIS